MYPDNEIPVYCEVYLNVEYLKYLIKNNQEIPNYFHLCNLLKERVKKFLRLEKIRAINLLDNGTTTQSINLSNLLQIAILKIKNYNKPFDLILLKDDIVNIDNKLFFIGKESTFEQNLND